MTSPTGQPARPAVTAEVLAELRIECESRVCQDPATHALVFRAHCRCPDDRNFTWLLCLPHIGRGLQELRERFAWGCNGCGQVGFWCTPVRVESFA